MEKQLKLNDVLEHLSHKERHISDLTSFLRNMCDKTPNYTLFLGSGCSVTSGVNSGADLIKQWKEEIYAENAKTGEGKEEFWKNQYKWFDERNPYSSLFQKKYDLPRQRRIFVERQVSNKIPSIGYAYLIKLIEKNYFNTVFTTNFDDLLNEAFYRYSGERPIVCAHDSSISSITLTSLRPKIIKLHGDYLFDDIKSTLRETESLNDNMKEKFIEFSKDHGLIVVGYAGHDRSIMDILSMLLQKEDYFKHGIYWCVRDGDEEISDELHHLLWKDRVYYVRIKGFDELMAALNNSLNDGELPIDRELLSSSRQKRLIRDLTDNKYISKETKEHEVIKRDISRLSKIINKNIINDFWDIYSKQNLVNNDETRRKLRLRSLSENEQQKVNEIRQYIENDENDKALKEVNQINLDEKDKSKYAYAILNLKKELYIDNKQDEQLVRDICDKIIELDPSREKSYIEAYNVSTDKNAKISYLDKAIQQFPQDTFLYNQKARFLLDYCYDDLNSEESKKELLDVVFESVDKSLQLKDLPTNMAWFLKCRYIDYYYEYDFDRKKEEINKVFNKYSNVKTPYLADVYETYYKLLDLSESSCEEKIKDLYKAGIEADDNAFVENTVVSLLRFYAKNKKMNEFDIITEEFEKNYSPSEDYVFAKVSVLAYNLGRYKEAEKQLLERVPKSSRWQNLAFRYFCETKQEDHAKQILETYFPNDIVKKIKFHSSLNHDEEVIALIDEYWKDNSKNIDHISYYTCSLLRLKRYDDAYTISKKYYDDPHYKEGSIYINFFIAERGKFKKDNKDRIRRKIIDDKKSFPDIVLAAAYALIGDRTNMYPSLRSAIKKDDLYRFVIGDWPVFADYLNDDKFKDLLKTNLN